VYIVYVVDTLYVEVVSNTAGCCIDVVTNNDVVIIGTVVRVVVVYTITVAVLVGMCSRFVVVVDVTRCSVFGDDADVGVGVHGVDIIWVVVCVGGVTVTTYVSVGCVVATYYVAVLMRLPCVEVRRHVDMDL